MIRTITTIAAAAALLTATGARADEVSAWRKFEYRANGILDAIHAGLRENTANDARRKQVKAICQGVSRDSMGGEGYVLPGWGRALMTACSYVDEMAGMNLDRIWSAKDYKNNCKQMKTDAADLLKAKPVAVAPGAHEAALHLGSDLMAFYLGGCKHKKGVTSPYHPA